MKNSAPKPYRGPLPRVTIDDILSWNPCAGYDRQRLIKLFRGRKSVSALDVIRVRIISAEDKMWCVCRPEMIPDRILHELSWRFAERALKKYSPNADKRSWAAITTKRMWVAGEVSDKDLVAARSAAYDAANTAAYAAYAAACATAYATARAAAAAAAADCAVAACAAAARNDEKKWQLRLVTRLLREAQNDETT